SLSLSVYTRDTDLVLLCATLATHYSASIFFFYLSGAHRDLHSFPTRRSSDLISPKPGSSGRAAFTAFSPNGSVVAATGEDASGVTACAPSPAAFTPVREPFS